MNKKMFAPSAVVLSAFAVTLLTGCQSIGQQIAQKMTEGVVNQASGGKVNLSDKNGNMTITDNQGNVAQIGGGDQRPASVPSDMPSLPGAMDFAWFGNKDGGVFTFTVPTNNYKTYCDQMVALVKAAGWADSANGFTMEIENNKTMTYEKPGYGLTLSCSTNGDNNQSSIALTKGKQDNAAATTDSTQAGN